MAKRHLRLVVSNKQVKKSILTRFFEWLNKPRRVPGVMTYAEKRELVVKYLTLKFADYQLTTGEVGLFPLCEALNEVEKLERNNQLENYYKQNKRKIAG